MRLSVNSRKWFVVAVFTLSTGGWGWAEPEVEEAPIEKLRIPVEYYESGEVKVQVIAELANVSGSGDIQAKDVRIEFYTEDGSLRDLVTAERCEYLRERGIARSDSGVSLERDGLKVTGHGFVWHANEERIKILSDTRVVIDRAVYESMNITR